MKRRHWIVAGVAAWALVVGVLAYYSYRNDHPTSREQTTIADALPTMDTALGRVHAALDPATTVSVLGGYTRTERSCRVTSAREGTRFERVLIVYTKKDQEPAVLDRVKSALPAGYGASVTHTASSHVLNADAGGFVAMRGGVTAPGTVRFTVDSGCRVQDKAVTEAIPPSESANRAPVQAVLDTLGQSAESWSTHRLTCQSGGTLWTVEATAPGDAAKARTTVPPAAVVLDDPKVFAYRAGAAGVSIRTGDGELVITSTAGC
ncbi:hypothetical protein Drose_02905 [Dactylosporangium roseum]|uniref:Uncharacterized protein n=1 Tax=Dactylosporangium roseum TaxID=47989 RepID=A0ABY5ZA67_9ACTN|nr:hypothetical protein [Dactylosporangium roseum]UWZ37259.1 hypothetical protein Drose_02905 [Dactylosporangium roseum]